MLAKRRPLLPRLIRVAARPVLSGAIVLLFMAVALAASEGSAVLSAACCQDDVAPSATGESHQEASLPVPPAETDPFPVRELPPLSRMVLYNSGVGQLQHRGTIDGNARVEILFGDYAVDDVLKSLVLVDHGGGFARAFEYKPAPDPEDVAASTIGGPMTLAQMMQSFRGEKVLLTSNGEESEGIIYGLENRAGDKGFVETVVLLTDRGMQSVPIPSINRLQFQKEELRLQLAQAMEGLVKARRQNQKQINLILEGNGERVVEFGYVIDMPIWRMTYRLAIDGEKAYLQGWAHVDNVTGVDWKEIEMELRSGQPYVWHANVFSPLRTQRPSVGDSVYEFSETGGTVSRWFGFDGTSGDFASAGGGGGGFGGGGQGGGGFGGGLGGSRNSSSQEQREEADEASTFRSFAAGSQDRQIVRYKIDHPVTLKAGRSAAIPVFGHTLPVSLLTVWTDSDEAETLPPAFAVEIVNDTGLPMVAGPVSISRKGDFAGDARLPRLAEKERKVVVFGVDRAIHIDRKLSEPEVTSRRHSIKDSELVLHKNLVTKRSYLIRNNDVEPRSALLFISFEDKEGVAVSPEPQARSDGMLQYRVNIDAQSTSTLEVSFAEETASVQALDLFSRDDLLRADREKTIISADDRQFLQKLVEMDQEIAKAVSEASALLNEKTRLLAEQERMRENVQALKESPDSARPYIDKMLELETSLETNRVEAAARDAEITELKKQKSATIEAYSSK